MNRQYLIDFTPVWMEHELDHPTTQAYRERKARSLANHLFNNWDMIHPPLIEWGCRGCRQVQYYGLRKGKYYTPACEYCGSSSQHIDYVE